MSKRDMGKEFIAHITEGLSRKDVQAGIIKGKIASAILIKRCELGMNQTTFARYMGVSQAMVSKWKAVNAILQLPQSAKFPKSFR